MHIHRTPHPCLEGAIMWIETRVGSDDEKDDCEAVNYLYRFLIVMSIKTTLARVGDISINCSTERLEMKCMDSASILHHICCACGTVSLLPHHPDHPDCAFLLGVIDWVEHIGEILICSFA